MRAHPILFNAHLHSRLLLWREESKQEGRGGGVMLQEQSHNTMCITSLVPRPKYVGLTQSKGKKISVTTSPLLHTEYS